LRLSNGCLRLTSLKLLEKVDKGWFFALANGCLRLSNGCLRLASLKLLEKVDKVDFLCFLLYLDNI
jgi:hypothetical protein